MPDSSTVTTGVIVPGLTYLNAFILIEMIMARDHSLEYSVKYARRYFARINMYKALCKFDDHPDILDYLTNNMDPFVQYRCIKEHKELFDNMVSEIQTHADKMALNRLLMKMNNLRESSSYYYTAGTCGTTMATIPTTTSITSDTIITNNRYR